MQIARLNSEAEIFRSIQGEGPRSGCCACFLRLAGCNLACTWCDTKYSWGKGIELPEAEVAQCILALGGRNLIITGGEPLLQQESILRLLELLPQDYFVEVESNGSIAPAAALQSRIGQWNISPKLPHAGNRERQALRQQSLAAFAALPNAYFKFVVRGEEDWPAIEALGLPQERIILMPCADSREALQAARPAVVELCLRHNVRFGDRLHLQIWDKKKGV